MKYFSSLAGPKLTMQIGWVRGSAKPEVAGVFLFCLFAGLAREKPGLAGEG